MVKQMENFENVENFENSWKNKTVFEEQLELNLKELNREPPSHWQALLDFIATIKTATMQHALAGTPRKLLDIGCGCGAIAKLLHSYYPEIEYTGMDYASEAISLATAQWPFARFLERDYKDITKEEIAQYDIVYACSLHNVLPDGDAAIDALLALKPKYLILGKLLTTHDESYYETYQAYNLITTYKYFHNYQKLHDKLFNYGNCIERRDGMYVYHYLLESEKALGNVQG